MEYESQSARDAQRTNYGGESYWQYLDDHARELRDKFAARDEPELAEQMMTRSLSESLMGNDGP